MNEINDQRVTDLLGKHRPHVHGSGARLCRPNHCDECDLHDALMELLWRRAHPTEWTPGEKEGIAQDTAERAFRDWDESRRCRKCGGSGTLGLYGRPCPRCSEQVVPDPKRRTGTVKVEKADGEFVESYPHSWFEVENGHLMVYSIGSLVASFPPGEWGKADFDKPWGTDDPVEVLTSPDMERKGHKGVRTLFRDDDGSLIVAGRSGSRRYGPDQWVEATIRRKP